MFIHVCVLHIVSVDQMELEQWDAAMNVLGEDSTKDYGLLQESDSEEQKDEKLSSIFYLRGVVFEKNENFSMASNWYIQSLTKDRFRVSAFRALQRMRSFRGEDEESLIQNRLGFDEKVDFERLIRGLYGTWGSASTQVKRRYMESLMKWDPWKEMLAKNRHIQAAQAEIMFDLFDMEKARTITQRLVTSYPHFERGVLIHAATLVECGGMNARCELFSLAQHWIDSFPNKAISFFIVGSYYYLIKKFDHARKFFARSLELDRQYAPSLLGLAHACSAEDEYDQAMASYRIACRIFPGAHIPRVSIAMEHITSGNYSLAMAELEEAATLCPDDPSVCHERGVVEFKLGQYAQPNPTQPNPTQPILLEQRYQSSFPWMFTYFMSS
jgi:anaphase-promoting complex subunit 6